MTKPYPGAFTFAAGRKVLVWWAANAVAGWSVGPQALGCTPGTILAGDGIHVVCGDRRLLRLERIEIDGREGDALEFADVLKSGVRLGGA